MTLPLKEFDLLFKLGSRPGATFTRDTIIEDVWGMDFDGTERTVDVHVNRLRDRFPEERFGFKITSIRGLGISSGSREMKKPAQKPRRTGWIVARGIASVALGLC